MTTTAPGNDDLSDAERELMGKATTGDLADVRAGEPELDNPACGADWAPGRTVRADLLVALLTGERAPEGGGLRAVRLRGARITGRLNMEADTFKCPLVLWDCHLDEPADFSDATASSIRLTGSHLSGFTARQLRTTGDVSLDRVYASNREVILSCARIGGSLHLDGVRITNNRGPALTADRLTVSHNMFCGNGFTAVGEVSLIGADIGGDLHLQGANLTGTKPTNHNGPDQYGPALNANGLTVGQNMFCHEDLSVGSEAGCLTAVGEVRLIGARIGGDLHLQGANLTGSKPTNHNGPDQYGPALDANGLTVSRNMFCCDGFTTCGEVRLTGARIGGDLHLQGAKLTNQTGPALSARGLTISQDMICQDLNSHGSIDCSEAHIGGRLDLSNATLVNPGGVALDLDSARAAALVLLTKHRPDGSVNLTNAKVDHYADDPAGWPEKIRLRGFTYDVVDNDQVTVRERLNWLARDDSGYAPQTYDQLAAAYRNAGRRNAARRVGIARQRQCRSRLNPINLLWDVTVGYGYRTWLAGAWLVAFLAVGTCVFSRAHMIATEAHPPAFHAFAYAADVTVPIISLGQKSAWDPQGAALYWSWALTAAGWVLTTAAVAGLTGILKRD